MVIERFYTKDGMPAFVRTQQTVKGQATPRVGITYPRAPDFRRLWDRATEVAEEPVAPDE